MYESIHERIFKIHVGRQTRSEERNATPQQIKNTNFQLRFLFFTSENTDEGEKSPMSCSSVKEI